MGETEVRKPLGFFYVARQPIFTPANQIWGYELLFRSGTGRNAAEINDQDLATIAVATCGFLQSQETADITKKICINFTEKLILEGAPLGLPPSVTVIEVLEHIQPSPALIEALLQFKQEGYLIAIDDYEGSSFQRELLDYADIVKVDVLGKDFPEIEAIRETLNGNRSLKIAEKVDSRQMLDHLSALAFDLYQGYFFAKPEVLSGRKLESSAIAKLRILQSVENAQLSPETIEEIIISDPSVTYRLLRLINSPAFGFSMKIRSVRQAILLLGLKRLRYWLRMVVMSDILGDGKTPELYIMSLNRGRILEELSNEGHIQTAGPDTLFLFGMLSLIEAMLEVPLEEIMKELPLSEEIKAGYFDRSTEFSRYLDFLSALETADASEIERMSAAIGVSRDGVADATVRSLAWVNSIAGYME